MHRRTAIALALTPILAAATVLAAVPAATQAQVSPIQHVVVIYLENHSFDNLLGYWCDQVAAGQIVRLDGCPDGGMPTGPVTLSDGEQVTPGVAPDTVPPVNHSVAAQVAAMDGGLMDGWENIPPKPFAQDGCNAGTGFQCITGYQPSQVPDLTNLATTFAVSDMTFSMADSPSWGGHLYAVAGSLDGFTGDNPAKKAEATAGRGWGCDSNKEGQWAPQPGGTLRWVPSCIPDPALNPSLYPDGGAFEPTPVKPVPTIMDRLGAAGLSWKIYGAPQPKNGGYAWAICPSFAECLDTPGQRQNLVDPREFLTDAAAGTLPAFSVVTPGGSGALNSCHNKFSITACDNWIGQLVGAAESSPDWASTAVFITWDDFGGFYDQVPPPAALNADGTPAGPRSPLVIVSPYAKPGYTDTTPTTFAGILAFTEQAFGLAPLGANDAAAYPFSNAFDYSQVPVRPVRMVRRPLPASAKRIRLGPALHDAS